MALIKKRGQVYNPWLAPPPRPFKTPAAGAVCDNCGRPAVNEVNLPDIYTGNLCGECIPEKLPYPYNENSGDRLPATGAASTGTESPAPAAKSAEDLFAEGTRFFCGDGVAQNKERALELFTAAAEMGHTEAQYDVGLCYWKGRYGKPFDWKQAVCWLEKAALKGNADAAYDLGTLYTDIITGPPVRDYKKAAEWFARAADTGHAKALNDLGKCYAEGTGVPQDYKLAKKLWKEASRKGCANAEENLQILKRKEKNKME